MSVRTQTLEEGSPSTGVGGAASHPLGLVVVYSPDGRSIGRAFDSKQFTVGRDDLADPWLSSTHLSVRRRRTRLAVKNASARNPVEIDGVGITETEISAGQVLRAGATVFLATRARPQPGDTYGIVGASPALAEVRAIIRRLGRSDYPIYVSGPSGTGKELVSQALHAVSGRSGACVAVNMSTLDPQRAQAELFGATKGAYTGCDVSRDGLFAQADGGTLFLDEIGELDLRVQAMLLRVLAEGVVRPLGSARTRSVNVRVVAATHRDLHAAVEAKTFREDLYWRLATASIDLSPIAARPLDVAPLLFHFLQLAGFPEAERMRAVDARWPVRMARVVARALLHSWPGNAREIQGVARQLTLQACAAVAGESDRVIGAVPSLPTARVATRQGRNEVLARALHDAEAMENVLVSQGLNIKATAELLAAAAGRSPESVRRDLYRLLGRERIEALRAAQD